jgi:protocatechuate 3,4-dioxygenase beta subunit
MMGLDGGASDAALADAALADAGLSDAGLADAGVLRWATGGTVSMTGAAAYPNPFVAPPDPACALTLPTTLGPCFYTSPDRIDVSEGYPGLPMRLMFRVLDASCAPLAGARLDIWHTGHTGLYSGGPIDFCTGADPDAIAHLYFRGSQLSDADGVVRFDTCFPGAYDGRALHIHFQVFPSGSPTASIVSQVFFDQGLIDEIFALHPDYVPFGLPNTTNAADGIYGSVGAPAIVAYERMEDGAMLAWKDVILG